jgi:hypothetical protein
MSTDMPLDCDGFAAQLADYLEGDAPDAVRHAVESHAAECLACRQLLDDLSALRHDAAALPLLTPSRDLWDGIAERIDAKVVPIGAGTTIVRPMRRSWLRPSLAAAALVIVTAGVTHLATRLSIGSTPASVASRPDSMSGTAVATAVGQPTEREAQRDGGPSAQVASVESATAPSRTTRATGEAAAPPRSRVAGSRIQPSAPSGARLASTSPLMRETEPIYAREIVALRQMLQTRRAKLDPSTIAVLEQSMAVIDSAIAQSRAALAKDPASGFLATQLNQSLEKKVELLRTAATLPART